MDLDALRETALVNFEKLLALWDITYKKISDFEYDILAKWRKDESFGGCRFNTKKGRGADFAGFELTESEMAAFGVGFDVSDFASCGQLGQTKVGFDIVGLCQRVHSSPNYREASKRLEEDLVLIKDKIELLMPAIEAARRRAEEEREAKKKRQKFADKKFKAAEHYKFIGSLGEEYLASRGITTKDLDVMRFVPSIQNSVGKWFPALIFKVQKRPEGQLEAIHRIYLEKIAGKVMKARVPNPKEALGPIAGCGIWFGVPSENLFITEGPENALYLRENGAEFAVSTIFVNNMDKLEIPPYVNHIYICYDNDPPGRMGLHKAIKAYSSHCKVERFEISEMAEGQDINDLRGNNG